jgi:Pentapeptide repeats (8 copies)
LLDHAQLQGASLYVAQLQVASLQGPELQGASLYNANLPSFNYAQLQGTWFYGADLEGAELRNVHVWRTDARQAWPKDNTYVEYQEIGPTYKCDGLIGPSDCDQLANAFEKLEQLITDQVPEGRLRSEAMKRIEDSLNPTKALEGEDEMAKVWWEAHPAREVYEERVAKIWRETGCATEGAPYVLPRLLLRLESSFAPSGPQLPELAKAFLDEEHCPGAHGLSDTDKAKLKEIRDRSPPPASKP